MKVLITRLDQELPLPSYAKPGDAGMDIYSTIDLDLAPGARALVPTGIAIALPPGYVALVHPRSGLALKHGITLANSPGTIDASYRGEVKVIMINLDQAQTFQIKRGERIAQLVFQRVELAELCEVASLPSTTRGRGGFGSTGTA